MLNKKDYEVIAKIINNLSNNEGMIGRYNLVENLSYYFVKDNPNFNRDKFCKACYGEKR